MHLYADIYLLLNYSTCFGRPSHPSSGVHKTVVVASGTNHTNWGANFIKRDKIRTGLGVHKTATIVLCTRDDGRDGRPKHVEQFSSK